MKKEFPYKFIHPWSRSVLILFLIKSKFDTFEARYEVNDNICSN
jgi:hypothetical protein